MKKNLLWIATLMMLAAPLAARWTYMPDKDPITDRDRSMLLNVAEGSSAIAFAHTEVGLVFLYRFNSYFIGFNPGVHVTYRIDDDPPVGPARWVMAADHRQCFMPMGDVAAFRRRLLTAEKLVIRAQDSDGETITRTFDVRGLRAVNARL